MQCGISLLRVGASLDGRRDKPRDIGGVCTVFAWCVHSCMDLCKRGAEMVSGQGLEMQRFGFNIESPLLPALACPLGIEMGSRI